MSKKIIYPLHDSVSARCHRILDSSKRWTRISIIAAAIACSGCLDAAFPPRFTSNPVIAFNPNPQAPLTAIIKFSANKPVRTAVRIKDGDWERELLFDSTHDPEQGLPIAGLVPDRTHEIRVFIHDDFGRLTEAPEPLAFHSLGLPTGGDAFPPFELNMNRPEDAETGISILNLQRRHAGEADVDRNFGMLVALNGKGKVVWYFRADSRIDDFRWLPGGRLTYETEYRRGVEIDLLGNVLSARGEPNGQTFNTLPAAFQENDELLEKGNDFRAETLFSNQDGAEISWARVREYAGDRPDEIISEVIVQDTSALEPTGWVVSGFEHIPYLIPCNYCYAYPGPPRPRKRPF